MLIEIKERNSFTSKRYANKLKLNRPNSLLRIQSAKKQDTTPKLPRRQTLLQTIVNSTTTPWSKLKLSSTSWCLFDLNKDKEIGFRQSYQRQIASLTKIMTTILVIELIQKFQIKKDLLIRVTNISSQQIGTTASLKYQSWIKLIDLLYGVMLPSGNDAAYLLAEVFGFFLIAKQKTQDFKIQYFSTIDKIDLTKQTNTISYLAEFLKQMNQKANQLHLFNTRFSNPHGLQNAMNFSSAKDVITLSIYASKNILFTRVMNSQHYSYIYYQSQYLQGKCCKRWWSTNQLLKKNWNGIKTGQTISAGCCLSSLKNGIYIVVLNCSNHQARFNQTQKIYNWYQQNYGSQLTTMSSSQQLLQ